MNLTIKDVANLSGVSKSTVSRVINNRKYVSKKNRERVSNIINETGYIPNNIARSLVTNKTYAIGLIIPDITNPFYSETAKIIEDTIRELGYSLIICNTDNRSDLQNDYINILKQRKIDGIIFGSVRINDTNVTNLSVQELPYITYHRKLKNENTNYIISDDITGIKIAVKYLVDLGHKNIAYISGPTSFSTGINRLNGFIEARNIFNLNNSNDLIKKGGYSEYQSWQATKAIINLTPRPSAIIAANDLMAISALDCILHHGLAVPKDISLIGYDNINLASHARIQLTTISIDKKNMAKKTANLLIKEIINKKNSSKLIQIKLKPRLIVRKTTMQKKI